VSLGGAGWKPPGAEDALPFGWLRRFLYEHPDMVWLARILDDSLFTLRSDNPNPSRPQKLDGPPPAVAEAVRIADAAGLPFDSTGEYLELNRLQIGYTARVKARSVLSFLKLRLRELVLGLVAFVVTIYAFLPLWGLARAYRIVPTFTGWAIRRFRESSLYGRLFLFPLLYGIGLSQGVLAVALLGLALCWPPAFLKRIARTGDAVLIAPGGRLFYSAFHRAAVFVPMDWPLIEGRFKKHYIALGYGEDDLTRFSPLWIARLPADWVKEEELNIEPRCGDATTQLLDHARSRFTSPP
jgi:hypothetical protein